MKLMGQTQIGEKIDVLAKFSKGNLTPLLFRYHQRIYKIDSIDLKYDLQNGDVHSHHFCVTSQGVSYKISFRNLEMSWYLEEIDSM